MLEVNPLVTVVTVTYNSSAYVRDAIESILSSSYANFELIIGDDASTDNTWSIIQEYNDPRIIAYRNEKNFGEYPNRNKAINLAKGEYLIFIDGDDMIYPYGLEYMVSMMENNPRAGMLLMHPYLNWVYFPIMLSPREFYVSTFFSKGFNNTAFTNTFLKIKVLKDVMLLPTKFKAGDTYVRLKIASKYHTLIAQDQLTWWRETPGQASQLIWNNPVSILESYHLHLDIISNEENPLTTIERKQAITNELFKVKLILFRCIRRLEILHTISLLKNIFVERLAVKVIFSKRTHVNPFSQYSPSNPRTIHN